MVADYYEVLGITKSSSEADIKKAYRKMAMKYHPDRHKGDKEAEKKFKEINEAYEVLKDPQKKAAYDQYGHEAFSNQGGGGYSGYGQGGGGAGFSGFNFEDIINEMFGGGVSGQSGYGFSRGQKRSAAQPGSDIRFDMSVTLEEALSGTTKKIKYKTYCKCETCSGKGSADSKGLNTCSSCRGAGVLRSQQGFFTMERTCPVCKGAGQVISNPCKNCGGQGRFYKEKNLEIKIPEGVDNDTKVRLSGEGEAGVLGGVSGDLYIFISVKDHEIFQRSGKDLFCEVPMSIVQAILGGTIEVTSIDKSKVKLDIPAGTQTGQQFRIKGSGMPSLRGNGRGDLYVKVKLETPVKLTKKQKELLLDFEKEGKNAENYPAFKKFFSKF